VVTPLDEDLEQPLDTPFVAWGKDLSIHGLSFVHEGALPYRVVNIAFESAETGRIEFVARLKWCRFRRDGLYESGGQFLRLR
jgi:hypothetical protein